MKATSWFALVACGGAVVLQYIFLLMAACTPHVTMMACLPKELGGYSKTHYGWDKGVCFTEEQLWCRKHPNKHPDCRTSDCRAEEVRLSMPRGPKPKRDKRVYDGCGWDEYHSIFDHMSTIWFNPYEPPGAEGDPPPPPAAPPLPPRF